MRSLIALTLTLTSLALASDSHGPTVADNELRGHVKQCVEHTVFSNLDSPSNSSNYEYSPEGLLLEQRSEYGGGTVITTSYIYNAGRLVKTVRTTLDSQVSDPHSESTYSYDAAGRLLSVSSGANKFQTYEYDPQARKRLVQRFPTIKDSSDVVLGGFNWENGELPVSPTSGGTLTTLYDEHDRPIDARVQDANGRLTQHIVRRYDEQGHILGDQLSSENMDSSLPPDFSAQLNAAQRQTVENFMTGAFGTGQSTYKYDTKDRLVEKNVTNSALGNQLTTYKYDEHGNVSDEETVSTPSPAMNAEYGMDENGKLVVVSNRKSPPPSRSSMHYAYEYDAQDNWTQKTVSQRDGAHDFKVTMTVYRNLTYY